MKTPSLLSTAALVAALSAASGCFTAYQTPYPQAPMTQVAGDVRVSVEGFEATVTDYTSIYSTEMVVGDMGYRGPRGRRRGGWGPAYFGNYITETYVPTVRQTDAFIRRASSRLEAAGCILRAAPATYSVRVDFSGPYDSENAGWKRFGIDAGTLLFALYDTASYSAVVKIYDVSSGKLLFHQAYEQEYAACGWSPIWIFGMMEYEQIDAVYVQTWCLNALVDRSMADVSSFLARRAAPKTAAQK